MTLKKFSVPFLLLVAVTGLSFSSCSSAPKHEQENVQLSANGPTVVNARAEPGTILLNGDLQPITPSKVLAEVKDFKSPVVETHLKFADVPLDVPMENIGGTTWKAELTPPELQMLAVSGKTVNYSANIVAQNAQGAVSDSKPLTLTVKTPDLQHQFG